MAQELKRFDIVGKYSDEETMYEFRSDGECYDADEVDAVLAEKDAEIRRLKRALWRAVALFCARSCEYFNGIMSHCLMGQDNLYKRCEEKKNKYLHAMYKCRAKAEASKEYVGDHCFVAGCTNPPPYYKVGDVRASGAGCASGFHFFRTREEAENY